MPTVLPATNFLLLLLLLLSRAVTELFNLVQMPTTTTTATTTCKLPAYNPYLWLKPAERHRPSPLGILFPAFNLMRFSQNEKIIIFTRNEALQIARQGVPHATIRNCFLFLAIPSLPSSTSLSLSYKSHPPFSPKAELTPCCCHTLQISSLATFCLLRDSDRNKLIATQSNFLHSKHNLK